MNIAKVDRDVAYVAMVVHVCCKGLLLMFHLCFSDPYCKCIYLDVAYVFIWMLRMVAMIFMCFIFLVFHKNISSVLSAFICMLQLLYLDVLKADRVLHLSSLFSAALSRCILVPAPTGHPYDAVAGSFHIRGTTLFSFCCSGGATSNGAREIECSAWAFGRGCPSGH
jgi:hypothetical protein